MSPWHPFAAPRPRAFKRMGRAGRWSMVGIILLGLYGAGFGAFIATLPQPFATLPPNLEGLATFTGGAGRVQALLHQLNIGFNGPILISGIRARTSLTTILAHAKPEEPLSPDQTNHILQDTAQSTRENVESLKVWAGYLGITRIGVITSTYHTARVRLLLWSKAPELAVTLLPVQPADAGWRPLLKEYNKLLLTPLLP